ncbi:MAG: hypothetical protein KDC35_10210 [Acidobacteria bacterium]|nr:hypothetical protein [Acidobacteriota bacterium]
MKKRQHRVSVYILDPDRRRLLLHKPSSGPFKDKYTALATNLVPDQTPHETLKHFVRMEIGLEIDFVSYGTSSPVVLDAYTVKLNAPLLVQVTRVGADAEFVDHVYVARARQFCKSTSGLMWFNTEELVGNAAPRHVKLLVREILMLVNS